LWGPKDEKTSKTNMMKITAIFEEFVTVLCTVALKLVFWRQGCTWESNISK
jgi:hypothetical protein